MFRSLVFKLLPMDEFACVGNHQVFLAIFHLHSKIFSRSKNQNCVAAAAYRSSSKLRDFQKGNTFDYTRKNGTVHSQILAPKGAPDWVLDRESLWNAIETKNRRKDAQLCREVEVALPRELSLLQNILLTQKFVANQFVDRGMVADVCIHKKVSTTPEKTSDGSEYHAHILLTLNSISPSGFGDKERSWNSRELLKQWRSAWADFANSALKEAGFFERIDARTLEAQQLEALSQGDFERARELNRTPEPKIGTASFHMKKRGLNPARYMRWLFVKRLNARRLLRMLTASFGNHFSRGTLAGPSKGPSLIHNQQHKKSSPNKMRLEQ